MALKLKTDWILFSTVVLMVFFGAVMVYSASSVMADIRYGNTYYFIERQVFWVVIGIVIFMVMKRTHYRRLQHPGVAFAFMSLVLIALVAVYFLDARQHRWIRLGPGGLQPSELAKPALAIFLAFFISLRARAINNRHTLIPALMAVGLVTGGVAVADLGTAIVLMCTAAAIFFVAGLEFRYCLVVVLIALVGVGFFIAQRPYRLRRVIEFVDPGLKRTAVLDKSGRIQKLLAQSLVTKDTNYQLTQSKIAVGVGGVFGQGLMQGRQKLLYLPEAHTDTIYAVVGEELGLVGSVAILIAFTIILWRGLRAAVLIPDDFGRYLALALTTMLVVQGFMNMSVVLGMMPTKGIPLPMISFGGSSLVSTLASLGLLLNISEHAG
jgi:cell division protein FtsW